MCEISQNPRQHQILQDAITLDVIGILWISNTSLQTCSPPFHALDYLFDGLLTNFNSLDLSNENREVHKNYFITESFGAPLFLGYINAKQKRSDSKLKELMSLVDHARHRKKTILIIDQSNEKPSKKLASKYSNLNFSEVVFEDPS